MEKFEISEGKCRTARINEAVRLMLLEDKQLENKKTGQLASKLQLSRQVNGCGQAANRLEEDLRSIGSCLTR